MWRALGLTVAVSVVALALACRVAQTRQSLVPVLGSGTIEAKRKDAQAAIEASPRSGLRQDLKSRFGLGDAQLRGLRIDTVEGRSPDAETQVFVRCAITFEGDSDEPDNVVRACGLAITESLRSQGRGR